MKASTVTVSPPEGMRITTVRQVDGKIAIDMVPVSTPEPTLKSAQEVWGEAKGAGHPEGWRAVSAKSREVVLADVAAKALALPDFYSIVYDAVFPEAVSRKSLAALLEGR